MTPRTELDRLFSQSLANTKKPDEVVYETPDLGHEAQERDHGGMIDFNEATAGDRSTVAHIQRWQERRDRNATPRSGGDEPEAAA